MNVPPRFGSNDLMSRQKLLKAPGRLLLLTFVLSTRMAVGPRQLHRSRRRFQRMFCLKSNNSRLHVGMSFASNSPFSGVFKNSL